LNKIEELLTMKNRLIKLVLFIIFNISIIILNCAPSHVSVGVGVGVPGPWIGGPYPGGTVWIGRPVPPVYYKVDPTQDIEKNYVKLEQEIGHSSGKTE
jgi:hypothetical protein